MHLGLLGYEDCYDYKVHVVHCFTTAGGAGAIPRKGRNARAGMQFSVGEWLGVAACGQGPIYQGQKCSMQHAACWTFQLPDVVPAPPHHISCPPLPPPPPPRSPLPRVSASGACLRSWMTWSAAAGPSWRLHVNAWHERRGRTRCSRGTSHTSWLVRGGARGHGAGLRQGGMGGQRGKGGGFRFGGRAGKGARGA